MSSVPPPPTPAYAPPPPAPPRRGRLQTKWLVAFVVWGLAAVIVVAVVVVKVRQPNGTPPVCDPAACPPPPGAAGLVVLQRWTSTDLGFQVAYDDSLWDVSSSDGRTLVLSAGNGILVVTVKGYRANEGSPDALLSSRLGELGSVIIGLSRVDAPEDAVVGPHIGFVHGVGGTFAGTLNGTNGPGGQVLVYALAASQGGVSAVVTAIISEPDYARRHGDLDAADSILDYFRFKAAG